MYAEACNELGESWEALDKLEMVRARARRTVHPADMTVGLPEITETGKEKLREIIWNERRHRTGFGGTPLLRPDPCGQGGAGLCGEDDEGTREDKLLDSKTCNVLHPAEAGGYLAGSPQKLI